MPPTPVEIVGGKTRHIDTGRDYQPGKPYRRPTGEPAPASLNSRSECSSYFEREEATKQNRETVMRALEKIGGQATSGQIVTALQENSRGAVRAVGQILKKMADEGIVERVESAVGHHMMWRIPGTEKKPKEGSPTLPPLHKKRPSTVERRAYTQEMKSAIVWAMKELGGRAKAGDIIALLGAEDSRKERMRVGQILKNMAVERMVRRVFQGGDRTSIWELTSESQEHEVPVAGDVPELPEPLRFAKNMPAMEYSEKIRHAILWALKQSEGIASTRNILKFFGKEDHRNYAAMVSSELSKMKKDGDVIVIDEASNGIKTWGLPKEKEGAETELTTEIALADLKRRMRRPELPEHHERIVAELRGVARQFEEIGASEMLIRDFRTTADWLEGLRDA